MKIRFRWGYALLSVLPAGVTMENLTRRRAAFERTPARVAGIVPGALRLIVCLRAQDMVVGAEGF